MLFVTYHFPPEIGGIQTRTSHYIEELRRRGISVTVFVLKTRGVGVKRYRFQGADVTVCTGGLRFLGRNSAYLLSAALSKRADVVHVVTGASTFLGIFSLLTGRTKRAAAVSTFFGKEQFELGGLLQRTLLLLSLRLSTAIGVNSLHTKGYLPNVFDNKTHVLLGGAEISHTVETQRFDGAAATILFVGRLVERKGGDDLIRAFRQVRESFPRHKLVFVGDGPERNCLENLTGSLGLTGTVEFRGSLVGQALQDAYEESAVVVLPSKHVRGDTATEGLGLTLIEASMHGKPLVGTMHGGIPSVVRDGINGLLVPEGRPEELAAALIRILSDDNLRLSMGRNALKIAEDEFTWRAATDRLLECYTQATGERVIN